MNIFSISDTHGFHEQIKINDNIDTIIHCGDSTNHHDLLRNQKEFESFLEWFNSLKIKNKILIAGNHDAWSIKNYNIEKVKNLGIHYLEHESTTIDNIKFFGSPYTPSFGNWYHMKNRAKLDSYWKLIDENCIDVLITHGPPKTILDLSYSKHGYLDFCGDNSLLNNIHRIKPKYHCFGHIHNNKDILNYGVRTVQNLETIFINCSMVEDGRFDKGIINSGQMFQITSPLLQ